MTKISDEAVKKATGKDWDEWFDLLDKKGARDLDHPEIVAILNDDLGLDNSWWCQSVTVEYEKHIGRRVEGQTADAGFEVGVQRTLPIDQKTAWKLLTSDEGLQVWLGASADDIRFEKGELYETPDGIVGEIRSVDPGNKVRLTYKTASSEHATTLQIYLLSNNGSTAVRFHHEKLEDMAEREAMKQHWQNVLERLTQ